MRRYAVQVGKPVANGAETGPVAATAPGSPRATVSLTRAPLGSSGETARLSTLVSVIGVRRLMGGVGTTAVSLSVLQSWAAGGVSVAPTRSESTPTCEHGPSCTEWA